MERVEGGVRGWGGKDCGAKCFSRKPGPWLTPIGIPVRRVPTKDGGKGTSIGRKARDRDQAPRSERKPGTTPPAPNHPVPRLKEPPTLTKAKSQPKACAATTKKPTGQSQQSAQSPMPTRQAGQQNTSHTNTGAKTTEPRQATVLPEPTPHILPYIGRGTVKTTNPKHTSPTRNHPAVKQTPPQYKAEKRDATAEPSDAIYL
ncbi:hypothetical protein CRENBAI_010352 [Crenichthys baileyi]|uniref:Uncharacterized protein n=1 Tax=Crenichthys baileyi TaxID=28760 RepID=A0AAV9QWV0_9TELE